MKISTAEGGGCARRAQGLVRNPAQIRDHESGRRHATGDQACVARLCGDALSARMHRRRRARDAQGALQALINLIDHGMSLQEAVEAPRVWTERNAIEVEQAVPDGVRTKLTSMGHEVVAVPTVAGGMNAI